MRLLADQWTAAGFPTLRYDHRGEGDSLCLDDPEGNAVEVWLDGVRAAITELRARTGVRRVVIGGLRVGASLAALMAEDADGLILLAPVLDGRSWVKRMRFLAGRQDSAYDKAIEFSGLYLSPATVEGLSRVDLAGARPPSCPIFLAAQNKLVEAYGAGLVSAGAKATVSGFPGFDALFMDAHSNSAPLDVFAMATAWLKLHFSTPRLSDPIAVRPWSPAELHHADGTERAVQFGPGLRGVVCTPAAPVKRMLRSYSAIQGAIHDQGSAGSPPKPRGPSQPKASRRFVSIFKGSAIVPQRRSLRRITSTRRPARRISTLRSP